MPAENTIKITTKANENLSNDGQSWQRDMRMQCSIFLQSAPMKTSLFLKSGIDNEYA